MTQDEVKQELEQVETMLEAIDSGDMLTTIRLLRSRLYYLQEQSNLWLPMEYADEEKILDR